MSSRRRASALFAQVETCEARLDVPRPVVGFVLSGRAWWAASWLGWLGDGLDWLGEGLRSVGAGIREGLMGRGGRAEAAAWRELALRLARVGTEGEWRAAVAEAAARISGVSPEGVDLVAVGAAGEDRGQAVRTSDPERTMVVVRHGHRDLGLLRVAIARGRCSTEIRRRLEALAALAGVAWAALRDPALGVGRGARLGGRDEATGLPDGRAFEHMLSSALEAARRVRGKLAVVLIRPVRIDSIRADDGSIFADAAIGLAARAARATVRASDPVARLEDDTLALLLPGASESNARRVAEAVRSAIAEAGQTASTPTPLTAVVGLAAFPGPATTAAALIAEARRVLSQSEVEPRPSEVPA